MLCLINRIVTVNGSAPLKYLVFSSVNYATDTISSLALGKSKKKAGKVGPVSEKIKIPVETDTTKLVNYLCGSNLLKEGGEDIKLGPDSDYPDWLYDINVGPPKKLHELDPNTLAYWKKVRKLAKWKNNKLSKLKRF